MGLRQWLALVVVLGLAAAACSNADPPTTALPEVVDTPPDVDLTRHIVPLDEIYFDTFDGRSVRLADSTPQLRERLLDAIPPIDDPVYGDAGAGDWLEPDDLVLGYVAAGQAYAYPFKILNFHEIVNDTIAGVPALISYCPLCRSAVVYDRRVDGQALSFGNTSALYESDLVMVDRATGSYWWQVAGRAIVGPLAGTELTALPSSVATWGDWKTVHADTRVLTRDTGFDRPYERDSFAQYSDIVNEGRFAFPVSEASLDERLLPATMVIGVQVGGVTRAYPIEHVSGAFNDAIAEIPLVILRNGDGASAFDPVIDGERLRFTIDGDVLRDEQTGSSWSPAGLATGGDLAGSQLQEIPSRTSFWFAFVGAFPDAELATP